MTSADRSELDSALYTIDELIRRIADAAGRHAADLDESVAGDLYEVERSLKVASRRLAIVVRKMD